MEIFSRTCEFSGRFNFLMKFTLLRVNNEFNFDNLNVDLKRMVFEKIFDFFNLLLNRSEKTSNFCDYLYKKNIKEFVISLFVNFFIFF